MYGTSLYQVEWSAEEQSILEVRPSAERQTAQQPRRKPFLLRAPLSAPAARALQAVLQRYAADKMSSLSRYIKVAAALPHKSVRDVALRVRWIGRKDTPRKQRSKVRGRPRAAKLLLALRRGR